MEEELNQILTNADMDNTAKAEAIKSMVGKGFVPISKFNSEKEKSKENISALQSQFDEYKASKMTEEEKADEQARVLADKYQKQNLLISEMYARNVFAEAGLNKDDYSEILEKIVLEDSEKTRSLAEAIASTITKQKSEAKKKVEDAIVNNTKTPPAGQSGINGDSETENYKKLLAEAQKRNDYVNMAYYSRLVQESQKK